MSHEEIDALDSLESYREYLRQQEDRAFINEEVDERLEELREFDRHPERYR